MPDQRRFSTGPDRRFVAALRRCFGQIHFPLGFVQAQDSCE